MAGELKKKILNRDQAASAESEAARRDAALTGQESATGEVRKTGSPKAGPAPKQERKSDQASAMPAGEHGSDGGPAETLSWWKRPFIRKTAISLLPVVILAAAGMYWFHSGSRHRFLANPEPQLEPIVSLKRPIPVPDYREMLDFLILNETDHQKTLVALRMEFTFHSPAAYQSFKDQNVAFRDTVYSFLQRQNALRNTHNSWHTVVEKDLFEYLKVKLPQTKADQIRLTQVENL
jgi:flagellar basal body-associated protein FliL